MQSGVTSDIMMFIVQIPDTEKYMAANKPLCINLPLVFERVLRDVTCVAIHKLEFNEWLVPLDKDIRSRELDMGTVRSLLQD